MNASPFRSGCMFLFLCILFSQPLFSRVIYVDANASGNTQNGRSWSTAYRDLQLALSEARVNNQVDEIWVAQGTYFPTTGTNRSTSFEMVPEVGVYGGFQGSETNRSDRDPMAYPTILSGEIGQANDLTDNSYHVVTMVQQNQEWVALDGFQVLAGQADGAGSTEQGGGIFVQADSDRDTFWVYIRNCWLTDNTGAQGGGLAMVSNNGAVLLDSLEDNRFTNNSATRGGAVYQYKGAGSQLRSFFQNCTFFDNSAIEFGGAVAHDGNGGTFGTELAPTLLVVNGVLSGNTAQRGACFFTRDLTNSFTLLRNLTCYDNPTSISGGQVFTTTDNNTVKFQNSIAWVHTGNPFQYVGLLLPPPGLIGVDNSIVEGGYNRQNDIIDADPDFLDPGSRDFRLEVCSPAIDQGISYGTAIGKDVNGLDRVYHQVVDIGAHEFDASAIGLPVVNQKNQRFTADGQYDDPEGWTHFYDCANRYLLLSLQTQGQDLGNPQVSIELGDGYGSSAVALHAADYLTGDADWWVMNRYWSVENANAFANPIGLRFYYDQTDVQDLISSSGGVMTDFREMTCYKVNGNNAHDPLGANYQAFDYGPMASNSTWKDSTYNGQTYAEVSVTNFSAGSAGWRGISALPVEWSRFYGQSIGNEIFLHWETASEVDNDYFILEKSADGQEFYPIQEIKSQGSGPNQYHRIDPFPYNGKNYYRIKQVDFNGAASFSPIIVIEIGKQREDIQVFPNPTQATLSFQLPERIESEINIRVLDQLGRVVQRKNYASGEQAVYEMDLSTLHPGRYILRVDGKRYRSFTPFVLMGK